MRTRVTSAVLFTAAVLSLAACSEEEKKSDAAATSTAAATTAAAPSSPPAAAAGASDKEICEAANKAGKAMTKDLSAAITDGDFSPAEAKTILGAFRESVLAVTAPDSSTKVGVAALQMTKDATKIAEAADPFTAMEDPAFEKAGTDLEAACKAVGVKLTL